MSYTFEEAERELNSLFGRLITESKTDKEKYYLKSIWETYKQGKAKDDYERGYEDGCYDTRECQERTITWSETEQAYVIK